jgi:hypothetical protein
MKNGKQVTVSQSHVVDRDGSKRSNVHEFVKDGNRVLRDERYVPQHSLGGPAQPQHRSLPQATQ